MLLIIVTLSVLLGGCQSIDKTKRDNAKILRSQKSIVISYLNSGLPAQAHGELRQLLAEHPDNVDFIELMGVTQLALHNHDKAVLHLHKAYQMSGKMKIGLNLSSALIATGSLLQAQRLLLQLLKKDSFAAYPHHERIYHNLGLIYQQGGDYVRAMHYYRKALSENPSYYLTLLKVGLLQQQRGRYDDALVWLNKAKNFCRKCLEPVKHLVAIHLRNGRSQQAFTLVDTFSRQSGLSQEERRLALALRRQLQKNRATNSHAVESGTR